MKKFVSKLFFAVLSTFSLSSCVFFNVRYVPSPYSYEHNYAIGNNEGETIKTLTIAQGEKQKVYPTIDGHKVPFTLDKWFIQDKDIVSVDKGVIKGKKAGTTYVTVEFKEGVYGGITVKVTATEKDNNKASLDSFFEMNGTREIVSLADVILYNYYSFTKESVKKTYLGKNITISELTLKYCDSSSSEEPFSFHVNGYVGEEQDPVSGERFIAEFKVAYYFDRHDSQEGRLSIYYIKRNNSSLDVVSSGNESFNSSLFDFDSETEHMTLKEGAQLPDNSSFQKPMSEEERKFTIGLINYAFDYYKEIRATYNGTVKLFE